MSYWIEVIVWYVMGISFALALLHAFSTMMLLSKNIVSERIFYVSMVVLILVWVSGLHMSMLSSIQVYVMYVTCVVLVYIFGSNVYYENRLNLFVKGEYIFEIHDAI